jgi:C_GCAxxG_C_C family probable redox protein
MVNEMNHKQKAVDYFSQKLHCSQSVLAAFSEECGITEEQALKLGSCFGGGMRKGEVCGAVSGALMVLGLLYGQKNAGDAEGRQSSNKVNDLMMDRFKEKCGSYVCNDLLGCDITTEEGHQHCVDNKLFTEFCPKMVAAAVDIVEEIISEQQEQNK